MGPDLGPNCLQRLSPDDVTCYERVNYNFSSAVEKDRNIGKAEYR